MALNPLIPALLIPFVAWRLYSRFKHLVGKQKLKPAKLWLSALFFPLLLALLLLATYPYNSSFAGLLCGILAGGGLAVVGLKLTRFENADGVLWFTPNAVMGISLFVLLMGRLGYRMIDQYAIGGAQAGSSLQSMQHSALTMGLLGMVFSYYSVYAIGVLRWRSGQALAANISPSDANIFIP